MTALTESSLTPSRAWTCVFVNLLATPGLGSLMARRMLAGTGQLVLALIGFFLLCAWIMQWVYRIFQAQLGETALPTVPDWLLKYGALFFGAGWAWSLVTSISLVRHAKAPAAPPKLSTVSQNEES